MGMICQCYLESILFLLHVREHDIRIARGYVGCVIYEGGMPFVCGVHLRVCHLRGTRFYMQ